MAKTQALLKKIPVPWYVTLIFALVAIALVPWLIWISYTLPVIHIDRGWNKAWTGLDIAEFAAIGLTALFGLLKSNWIIISSTAAGTLLLVDAWFDITTAGNAHERSISMLTAIFIELPLALLAFTVAYTATKHTASNH